MDYSERLLALLSRRDYVPKLPETIAKEWRLNTKEKKQFLRKVDNLGRTGQILFVKGKRLCLPQSKILISGRIQFRQSGSAIVLPEEKANEPCKGPIQIAAENSNVALNGDIVLVSLLKGRERASYPWLKPNEQAGCVIKIVERDNITITGTLHRGRSYFYVTPDDPRIPHDIIVADPIDSKTRPLLSVGDKVVVRLDEWSNRSRNPSGTITERLGRAFEPHAELAAIYHKYNLAPGFPPTVLREANALPDQISPADLVGRKDFRNVPTLTIDPDDAKDFDDAISLEYLPGGDLRIGVHIADVSHYVKLGTALDREARQRGNSTYLVGTVVPMLPEKLSNDLCSLIEAQDRLTKAAIFAFSPSGRLKKTEFANTVIRSRKRLTYRQAYALMFENSIDKIRQLNVPPSHQTRSTERALSTLDHAELADLQRWVRQLWSVARKLRTDRMRHGSLDIDMPEVKIFIDKKGYADRIEKIESDESHQLIEEFMLLANEAVARLTRKQNLPSLYRVHDKPDEGKLIEYRQFLGTLGVKVGDLIQRRDIVKLLAFLKDHPQGYLLRTQLLRSLRKAAYRVTPDGHYGLAKKDYTHFTSPIRRYADLMVHCALEHYFVKFLNYPASPHSSSNNAARTDSLAEHLSLTETNSTDAERDSAKVKLMEYFEREAQKKKKRHFNAIITDVRTNGFFVEVAEASAFGLVPLLSIQDDFYDLNSSGTAFVGRKTKRCFKLGHQVSVVVGKVDRMKRLIDFFVSQPQKLPGKSIAASCVSRQSGFCGRS